MGVGQQVYGESCAGRLHQKGAESMRPLPGGFDGGWQGEPRDRDILAEEL